MDKNKMENINRAKELIKKIKGLPKPCDICGERYQPTGKFQKLCYDCYCKKHQKRAIKVYGYKRKKIKKQ